MKRIVKIFIIITIMINFIELSKSTTFAVENENEKTNKFDVNNLIIKDEKYTKEYRTASGTKYTIIGEIKIEKIDIEYPILSDTSTELLSISLNKYWGANPNEVGNMCVVGHNYANLTHFGKLARLEIR